MWPQHQKASKRKPGAGTEIRLSVTGLGSRRLVWMTKLTRKDGLGKAPFRSLLISSLYRQPLATDSLDIPEFSSSGSIERGWNRGLLNIGILLTLTHKAYSHNIPDC